MSHKLFLFSNDMLTSFPVDPLFILSCTGDRKDEEYKHRRRAKTGNCLKKII